MSDVNTLLNALKEARAVFEQKKEAWGKAVVEFNAHPEVNPENCEPELLIAHLDKRDELYKLAVKATHQAGAAQNALILAMADHQIAVAEATK